MLTFPTFPLEDPEKILSNASGNAQKGMLILLPSESRQPELIAFLEKILAAIQYQLPEDVLLIGLEPEQKFSIAPILQSHSIRQVLLFGIPSEHIGVHFNLPKYHAIQHQQTSYLLADSLLAIYEERQAGGKKMAGALWGALKTMR